MSGQAPKCTIHEVDRLRARVFAARASATGWRARERADWGIPDPKHLGPQEFDAVRDEIARRVEELAALARQRLAARQRTG